MLRPDMEMALSPPPPELGSETSTPTLVLQIKGTVGVGAVQGGQGGGKERRKEWEKALKNT